MWCRRGLAEVPRRTAQRARGLCRGPVRVLAAGAGAPQGALPDHDPDPDPNHDLILVPAPGMQI